MKDMPYKDLKWSIECKGCLGKGKYDPRFDAGPKNTHFKCKGTGRLQLKEMTNGQYWMIKRLFNELFKLEIIVENDGLWNKVVDAMLKHRDAVAIENTDNMLTTKAASDIIEMLKDRKSRASNPNR